MTSVPSIAPKLHEQTKHENLHTLNDTPRDTATFRKGTEWADMESDVEACVTQDQVKTNATNETDGANGTSEGSTGQSAGDIIPFTIQGGNAFKAMNYR